MASSAVQDLWLSLGLPVLALRRLKFSGNPDLAINSSFRVGVAAQSSIGLAGLSAAYFHALKTGVEQDVLVDARHAVIQFRSETWYTIDSHLPDGSMWDSIAGVYKTKDRALVRIHTNFPHHRRGILDTLGIADSPLTTREEVSHAFMSWNALDFETEAASKRMCAVVLRSFAQWDEHPQAKALLGVPPVTLVKIADAPKRQINPNSTYPLEGIRVLDLSRVLAGPIAGKTLAAQGADVLLVTSPGLPALPLFDIETSLGKRSTQLDLTIPTDRDKLVSLVKDTDVFLQAYRPGGLEEKGFGTQELSNIRQGIICANITAWGWDGPWKNRRGFDSLVQAATGFNIAEAEAYRAFKNFETNSDGIIEPRPFPMQALDHSAAYLLAFGVNAALCKTVTEGGSWEVRVSLAAVGQWIRNLGQLSPAIGFGSGQPFPSRTFPLNKEISDLSIVWHGSGENSTRELTAIKQAAMLLQTPAKEGPTSEAPMGLNAHSPSWLPR